MIEKIFIPTVRRVNNQITYTNLPPALQQRVVMVVQAWERPQYSYPCEYLVLPDSAEYHYTDYFCLSRTREYIYHTAGSIKYAMLDDDLTFGLRNQRYFGLPSDMPKSKRPATDQDVLEMFDLFSQWLDEPEVTVCGCSHNENPPAKRQYTENTSLGSALWINGQDIKDILPQLALTRTRIAQDNVFLLSLLTRGFGNRVSQRHTFYNNSVLRPKTGSTQWDTQTKENTTRDQEIIAQMFPGIYNILRDSQGNRIPGGFRGYGKVKIYWNRAYKQAKK